MKGANLSLRELLYHRCETERRGREERKAHTKAASPASSASTKARSLVWSREAGLERGERPVLRGLRASPQAPGAAPEPPAPGHRVPAGAQGAHLARPGLPRSPVCTAPGAAPSRQGLRLRLCPGAPSAAAVARVAEAWPVLTCAPSAAQRAEESCGARARHPRGGPCSGGGSLRCLGRQGEGASLCCLFMRPRLRLGIGRREDVPAPARRARTRGPSPRAPQRPLPRLRSRDGDEARGRAGPPSVRAPATPSEPPCPPAPLPNLGFCGSSPLVPTEKRPGHRFL